MTQIKNNFFNRRQVLQGACGALSIGVLTMLPALSFAADVKGMRDAAAANGKFFGACVGSGWLQDERRYATAVARECNLLVAEYEMKWSYMRPDEATYQFDGFDRIAAFAAKNGQKVRGHTLVWHESLSDWAKEKLKTASAKEARTLMETHIAKVMAHTNSVVDDWDVVNEAVDHDSPRDDALRVTPWLAAMGPEYIEHAFRAASAANPAAKLVYNDYDLEFADPRDIPRRMGTLKIIERLKNKGIAIHALGLQSHLACHRPLARREFGAFLREVKNLGLEVIITELDIRNDQLKASDEFKAKAAGDYVRNYLNMVQENVPVKTLVTWGITTNHSWLASQYKNAVAPLPLDEWYERTPVWQAIHDGWAAI